MANKVMSLHDAVEKYVQDNDVLCLGGLTTNRKPYAAVYEILRQGKTGFVGWSVRESESDFSCGAGRAAFGHRAEYMPEAAGAFV